MQVLAAGSIAVASTSIHGILESGHLTTDFHAGIAINGWFILLSLIVSIFDMVAIGELFTDVRVLNIKIPFRHSLWYLSTIIVSFIDTYTVILKLLNNNIIIEYHMHTLSCLSHRLEETVGEWSVYFGIPWSHYSYDGVYWTLAG